MKGLTHPTRERPWKDFFSGTGSLIRLRKSVVSRKVISTEYA